MMRRESHEGHSDPLFELCLTTKCFRAHVDTDTFYLIWYVELVPEISQHLSVTGYIVFC
jgi:hypothetical protein